MNFICLAATNLEGVAITITTSFNILVEFHILAGDVSPGGAYLAKSDSAKSETAVQGRAKPYFAKPVI